MLWLFWKTITLHEFIHKIFSYHNLVNLRIKVHKILLIVFKNILKLLVFCFKRSFEMNFTLI